MFVFERRLTGVNMDWSLFVFKIHDSIIRHYDQIFLANPGKATSKHPGKEQEEHSISKEFHYRLEIKNSEVKNEEMWRE